MEELQDLVQTIALEKAQQLQGRTIIEVFSKRHDAQAGAAFIKLAEELFELQREANQHALQLEDLETEVEGLIKDFHLQWEMDYGERAVPLEVKKSLGLAKDDDYTDDEKANQEDTIYEKFDKRFKKAKVEHRLYTDDEKSQLVNHLRTNLLTADAEAAKNSVLAALKEIDGLDKKLNMMAAVNKRENREKLEDALKDTDKYNKQMNIITKLKP